VLYRARDASQLYNGISIYPAIVTQVLTRTGGSI